MESGTKDSLAWFTLSGNYSNCGCCYGSVGDSSGNVYFSSTEWITSYSSSGGNRWSTNIIPIEDPGNLSLRRQFLMNMEETILFVQDIGTTNDNGDARVQSFAFNSSSGDLLWQSSISENFSLLASVMDSTLIYIDHYKVRGISSSDGNTIQFECLLSPSFYYHQEDPVDVSQVLIGFSNNIIIVNSYGIVGFQVSGVSIFIFSFYILYN